MEPGKSKLESLDDFEYWDTGYEWSETLKLSQKIQLSTYGRIKGISSVDLLIIPPVLEPADKDISKFNPEHFVFLQIK